MNQLLEQIVRSLCDDPDAVHINTLPGEKTIVLEIRCSKEDVGKIIGKNGKTISTVRSLMNIIAAKDGRKAVVEIAD